MGCPTSDYHQPLVPPHRQRVVIELKELRERTDRLNAFINSSIWIEVEPVERGMLLTQYAIMRHYERILEQRIDWWKVKP